MSSDPSLALQKAIYGVLTGAAFQTACGVTVGVFDHVPQSATPPYIIISDIQDDAASAQAYDGSELIANLLIWSVKPGKVELRTIANQVRAFISPRSDLGAPFTLTGHRLITWKRAQTLVMDDADGVSVKAVVRLEFQTEPTTA